MSVVHGYLLGGLLLAGMPILVHLIMRQKPRPLPFPAFRFLRRQHTTNRRRLRLHHLLLLLLRMLLIILLCLALARIRVSGDRLSVNTDRPVAAVLVFDTSPSMGYTSGGKTALEEARRRALELLEEMAPGSLVAVGDASDQVPALDWLASPALAEQRIRSLTIRPAGRSLNQGLISACRLLNNSPAGPEDPPRFLYVFTDRTLRSWDAASASGIQVPEGVRVVLLDVGPQEPEDLAIDKVEIIPAMVPPGRPVQVHVTVRSTGREHENDLMCELGPRDDSPGKQPVRLGAGEAGLYTFELQAPELVDQEELPQQITVHLGAQDALPFNNTRQATFLVRRARRVLTIADLPQEARIWRIALEAVGAFSCAVMTPAEVAKLTDEQFRSYRVICLFQVKRPEAILWERLHRFVTQGGGLAVVPAGADWLAADRQEFNRGGSAQGLLPALFEELTPPLKERLAWAPFHGRHPLMAPFQRWSRNANPDFSTNRLKPAVWRYWKISPRQGAGSPSLTVAAYANNDPTLQERAVGKGKVLLFTTPLDARRLEPDVVGSPRWHTYWDYSSFGLVLADQSCRHLAGDSSVPEVNYRCGQPVRLSLLSRADPPYVLEGPGLATAETNLPAPEADGTLFVPQAIEPGNFQVRTPAKQILAGFSLQIPTEENFLDKVATEEIEAVLGEKAVLQVDQTLSLEQSLQGLHPPPVELLPYLMLGLLGFLTLEGFFANRFYKKEGKGPPLGRMRDEG
jgi:hypothetical protein